MSNRGSLAETTIAAISTAPGFGGIGVIRISGSQSLSILKKLFRPKNSRCSFQSHRLYYGAIHNPADGSLLDEVLAVFMQSPKTYTREDMAEIHCHGSYIILQLVLDAIVRSGARLADPGEFTERAFLNGRIDLTQAEAVIDILSAKTAKAADLAERQLAGVLFQRITAIRNVLAEMLAELEVAIDFPDEDIEIIDHDRFQKRLAADVLTPLAQLIAASEQGRVYRDGISVVIAGLPNVGKSSLLNALLQEDRALVTAVAGTTRDTIEEYLDIGGIPVRIIDTAGIREEAGEVESLGIERARGAISRADLVLFVLDGSKKVTADDCHLLTTVSDKLHVVVVNKSDLPPESEFQVPPLKENVPVVRISAREHAGMNELRQVIFSEVTGGKSIREENDCAPNVRHRNALIKARDSSVRVQNALYEQVSTDLLAVDLQECLDCLGEIVGETTTEDILDIIFSKFCLGK